MSFPSLSCNRLSDGDALSILMDEIKTSTNRCIGTLLTRVRESEQERKEEKAHE